MVQPRFRPVLEDSDLRDRLVAHRERHLVRRYQTDPREGGLLRRAMIDALLRHKPTTLAEFHGMIPARLVAGTDPLQLAVELPAVLALLRRLPGTRRPARRAGVFLPF